MSVKVAIRVRPFNQREKFLGCTACVEMKGGTIVVHENRGKQKKQHCFTFDYSFWSHDGFQQKQNGLLVRADQTYVDQQRVYGLLGQQILENAWVGFNCCLFAYGQTGAGKSYSMIGYGANKGIIPMACQQLFQRIRRFQRKGQRQYEVTVSMLQIYNQKVQDLFISTNKRPLNGLKVRQNKALGVYVQGLNKYPVFSYGQIEKKMDEGSKNRSLASTLMNEYSSRAHTIVMLEFIQKEWITNKKMSKKTSLINLVDLAGSQRVSKTGVGDNKDRLKEASQINKSLHTLGRVIEALADQSIGKTKNLAIPYRQSALTRILQNALGGNSKTTMICAISPANDNFQQTLSTLRYADKTKKIRNRPVVNESQVDKLIRQLREENDRLKMMLQVPQEDRNIPLKSPMSSQTTSERKQMNSNVRASMRQIQKQIRKNLESFAIDQVLDDVSNQQSLLDDHEDTQTVQLETSFTSASGKCQVYISNLNQDQLLNSKVKYSCQNNLLITNKSSRKGQGDFQDHYSKVVLCGLGIQENHAKIVRQNGKFFIQALSQSARQYTLLNGKHANHKQQLMHNDRIILGTNSVFLFKNPNDCAQSPNRKYTTQKRLDYDFAVNQRQLQLQNQGTQYLTDSRHRPQHGTALQQDKQLLGKLQQIEQQFARMIEQNQRKARHNQQKYRRELSQLQQQKQLKDREKQTLQNKLVEKKQQTYKLRTKQLQIQRLQNKLAQFQEEKQKRKVQRESMLLDDLGFNAEDYERVFNGQVVGVYQPPGKHNRYGAWNQPNDLHKNKAQKTNDKPTGVEYEQLLLQQYDEKSALETTEMNTTNSNSIRNQQSYQIAQVQPNEDEKSPLKMIKNVKKHVADYQFLTEAQQTEKQNKIVQVYLDKIRHKMKLSTKLYNIAITSEDHHSLRPEQVQEFNCQKNGGSHFCRHYNKIINKVQYISYNQNNYQYNQAQKGSLKGRSKVNLNKQINLNKSDLSDFLEEQSQKRRNSKDYKIRDRQDSWSLNEQSLLIRGSLIEFKQSQKIIRKRLGSQLISNCFPPAQIVQVSFQQDHQIKRINHGQNANVYPNRLPQFPKSDDTQNLQGMRQQTEIISQMNKKSQIKQSSFTQQNIKEDIQQKRYFPSSLKKTQILRSQFRKQDLNNNHQQANTNPHANQCAQSQQDKKSTLELYISHQNIQESTSPQKLEIHSQMISIKNNISKIGETTEPLFLKAQIQRQFIVNEGSSRDSQLQIKPKKSSSKQAYQGVEFDFSVSDIEEGDHQNSVQQSLNFSSLNTFKEQQLTSQIQLLKEKIYQLENQTMSLNNDKLLFKGKVQSQQGDQNDVDQQFVGTAQKIRHRIKMYSQKDLIPQLYSEEQSQSPRKPLLSKRLTQLPSSFSDKQFLRFRMKNGLDVDLQKQLQSNLVICNNENIMNQRNLNIRKRKRQVDQLKKSLFKKQKIELLKQLFVMIPMVQKFNLIAKEMGRLVQGKIQIQYRNFSHYEIIQALRNFTKSKWKKNSNFSNVQIRITIANLEQARIYKWAVQVFNNRFQIAQQTFQKYLQNSQESGLSAFNKKDVDKSRDPFWDPVDFVPSAVGYLSLECVLYDIGYEGWISFVHNSKSIAKAFVSLTPVKVKERGNDWEQTPDVTVPDRPDNQLQILNPRNLISTSLCFTLSIQSLTFQAPSRQSSPPLKFQLSYEVLVDDYKNQTFTTPQVQFRSYEQTHRMDYLRRHLFKQVSQSTLAYISGCPIKFTLNLMKDYSQQCLNSSFNQDLQKSIDETSLIDTSMSSNGTDITKQLQALQTYTFKTPQKSTLLNLDAKKPDFSKKIKGPVIYQNTELLHKIDSECEVEEKRRKEKRQKLKQSQTQLKNRKQRLKKQDKDCTIY